MSQALSQSDKTSSLSLALFGQRGGLGRIVAVRYNLTIGIVFWHRVSDGIYLGMRVR